MSGRRAYDDAVIAEEPRPANELRSRRPLGLAGVMMNIAANRRSSRYDTWYLGW